MNTKLSAAVSSVRSSSLNVLTFLHKIELLDFNEEVSDSCYFNVWGGSFWASCSCREDLQKLLTLAPIWKKEVQSDTIVYKAERDGIDLQITALEDALPDTCHLVEEEYTIPATEARVSKRMVVKCDAPVETPTEVTS